MFPIVGVGASAGGIEAIGELLSGLGRRPGVAVVIVLHQERGRKSLLASVLARSTEMPVRDITDGMRAAPDEVFVAPAGKQLFVESGAFRLRDPLSGPNLPIDTFLRSLAQELGSRAIAVILSGSASDGAMGAEAVKAEGGITFAQDDQAKFTSMPHSAVSAGAVDFVLSPHQISGELVRIAKDHYLTGEQSQRLPERSLTRLFSLLRTAHEIDLTHYKPATIERRVRRRMALHQLKSVDDYLKLLRDNPAEVQQLYNDVLIRVTGFFRDPEVFAVLEREVIPQILRDRDETDGVRVWVPGCATGEEVYSLAILFHEVAAALSVRCPVQIFGTDISEQAVGRAGAGTYPESIVHEVSEDRLRAYFTKVEGGYRVVKSLRDCCIFARHDVTKDPPFSRLDLISCRNVMIYFGAVLQRKVMAMFHYALRPNGVLLLGNSESVGELTDMFSTVNAKHRIYRKRATAQRVPLEFAAIKPGGSEVASRETKAPSVFEEADRLLLARYAPAAVVINDNLEILQFRGHTSAFLEPAPGAASFNLLKMARPGLLGDLRAALQEGRKSERSARRERVRIGMDGDFVIASLEVIPFTTRAKERFYLVNFEPQEDESQRARKVAPVARAERGEVARLKRELEATREYLQSIIEDQEAMNEELRSANEEIQSSNEELQSTNEEMETAKEELQSTNEELITLNEELEARNLDLGRINDDLMNILVSVEIPIVILDAKYRIRRFNPAAMRVLNVQQADVGHTLSAVSTWLPFEDLRKVAAEVVDKLEVREFHAKSRNGRMFSVRIRPYRTSENKIDGVVVVAIDLDEFRTLFGKKRS